MKSHKHSKLIKAWADGAEIETLHFNGEWIKTEPPSWDESRKYRIKIIFLSGKELDKFGNDVLLKRKTYEDGQIESDFDYRNRLNKVFFGMPELSTPITAEIEDKKENKK